MVELLTHPILASAFFLNASVLILIVRSIIVTCRI